MTKTCPVCSTQIDENEIRSVSGYDSSCFPCPLCGNFNISNPLLSLLPSTLNKEKDAVAKISHAIRQMQKNNQTPTLTIDTVNKILERPLPRPREQADLLIRWLAENIEGPGETIWVEPKNLKAIIGSKSDEGFALILNHLFDIGFVTGSQAETMGAPGRAHATLSFEGWDYYENLKHGGAIYRKAFMAMKFGDPILDKIVSNVFKPNVKQAGFELVKLDDNPKAGLIDDRLRVEIQSSDFIIADLTHDNHGAYWEAGYAEGMGKPVIYTCEKQKFETVKTHFDTNHHLTIVGDQNSPEEAGEALKATIRATLPQLAKLED